LNKVSKRVSGSKKQALLTLVLEQKLSMGSDDLEEWISQNKYDLGEAILC
jgi:hypothetical protein